MLNLGLALFALWVLFAVYSWAQRTFAADAPNLLLFCFPCHGLARKSLGSMGAHLYVAYRHLDQGEPLDSVFPRFVRASRLSLGMYEMQIVRESLGGIIQVSSEQALIDGAFQRFYALHRADLFQFLHYVHASDPNLFEQHMDHRYHQLNSLILREYAAATMHEKLSWLSRPVFQYKSVSV
jgi:hypothetical protein